MGQAASRRARFGSGYAALILKHYTMSSARFGRLLRNTRLTEQWHTAAPIAITLPTLLAGGEFVHEP